MMLAVDIGNTRASFAVMRKDRVVKKFSVDIDVNQKSFLTRAEKELRRLLKSSQPVKESAICSVVPAKTASVRRLIFRQCGIYPKIVGQDFLVPIKNNYHKPEQVGQDRLISSYAAREIYGKPAIIIDFGTAITFDIVSKQGAYEGGIIVPGIRLSAESLFYKTALLPKLEKIKSPRSIIGKTTEESILSGLFYGYGALSVGLIKSLKKRIGRAKVVVTGGYTDLMRKFIREDIHAIDDDLVFRGIYFSYQKGQQR